jgi:hypothetical protein
MNKNQRESENTQIYYIHNGSIVDGVFKKTPDMDPIATVTLLWVDGKMSRGVAICSLTDRFWREEGRKRSLKRARHALYSQTSDHPLDKAVFNFLSEFEPQLTEYEVKLLDIHKEEEAIKLANARTEMLATEAILNIACVPV